MKNSPKTSSVSERVLLTFTGFHDPFSPSAVAGDEREGPVLALVRHHPCDTVILFSTPNTAELSTRTVEALRQRQPHLAVELQHFDLEDPTDYFAILSSLRAAFSIISQQRKDAIYFVGTASGTPQMLACWVLLAASGEIPARLLQARNVKFITNRKPSISEIDPRRPEFPTVRSRTWANVDLEDEGGQDVSAVIERLEIVGDHPSICSALQTAALFAQADVPVLICGESGTGKENTAKLVHALSGRSKQPFVAVNCAAIPAQLAESTLFGHVKGAYTGATTSQQGKFAIAHKGTLFLDEVAELSLESQAKLLRVLQEGMIEPVGGGKPLSVDCRVIAATNCELLDRVKSEKFREDLYYRLHVGIVRLPTLRDRRSDIPKLAAYFLDEFNRHQKRPRQFTPEALAAIQSHDWPGNVRQLKNVIQSAAILASKGVIDVEHLKLGQPSTAHFLDSLPDPISGFALDDFCNEVRRRFYQRALKLTDGHQAKAAALLGCTPAAVSKYMKEQLDNSG